MYIDALHTTNCSVVASYRESHRRVTYVDVQDYAQCEGDAVRAGTLTSQAGLVSKPLQSLREPPISISKGL